MQPAGTLCDRFRPAPRAARRAEAVLRGLTVACLLAVVAASAAPAQAQPVTFRLGYGGAAEEPMWLIVAKADLARHYGKAYTLDATRFTSSDKRAQAFEAGAIDLSAGSANGVIFAAAEGITAKFIASISRESSRGFSTSYYVKESSPIRSVADLKGRTVGINGFSTSGHLWLKAALDKHGLADTDVRITPVPFSAMQESLEAGRIDIGQFPQPYAALLEKQMKVRKIFDAKYGVPFEEELTVLVGKDEFLKKNAGAVRALLQDFYGGDGVLSGETARSPTAPDRRPDGSGQFRRLHDHAGLLSRPDLAGRRRCTGENAGFPGQGRLPEEECRCPIAGRSRLSAAMSACDTRAKMLPAEAAALDQTSRLLIVYQTGIRHEWI